MNIKYGSQKIIKNILLILLYLKVLRKITIVMATWCSDSRREVPRFYKILDFLKFNNDNTTLINVNSAKKTSDIDISTINIQRVPTIFFYINNNEIGRIIETPKISLEKDMVNILSDKIFPLIN